MLTDIRETFRIFARQGGTLLGGALAFFALLSAVPLFVIALDIVGEIVDERAARAELMRGLRAWMGRDSAHTIASLVDHVHVRGGGTLERLIEALVLIYGSTRLFTQTQRALNQLWGVVARPPKSMRDRLFRIVRKRLLAFAMVLVCAVFLLVSTLLRTVLIHAASILDTDIFAGWHIVDHVITLVVSAALFTAGFRFLPDVRIHYADAGFGGVITAVLFSVGKVLIARYLANKTSTSAFGVAGSVVVVMLWVHYSAQIFFLGAAFTAVRAKRASRPLQPTDDAMPLVAQEN
jgi:membrane protein